MKASRTHRWLHGGKESGLRILWNSWWFFSPIAATSIGAAASEGAGQTGMQDFGSAAVKMFGSLLLIIGIIVFLFYLIKRARFGPLAVNRYPQMQLVGTLSVAPKRSVAVVEVGGQWLVLGVGTENVSLLAKLDDPPLRENGDFPTSAAGASFKSLFRDRLFKRSSAVESGRRES